MSVLDLSKFAVDIAHSVYCLVKAGAGLEQGQGQGLGVLWPAGTGVTAVGYSLLHAMLLLHDTVAPLLAAAARNEQAGKEGGQTDVVVIQSCVLGTFGVFVKTATAAAAAAGTGAATGATSMSDRAASGSNNSSSSNNGYNWVALLHMLNDTTTAMSDTNSSSSSSASTSASEGCVGKIRRRYLSQLDSLLREAAGAGAGASTSSSTISGSGSGSGNSADKITLQLQRQEHIRSVRQIFPHLSDGYLYACLGAYEWDIQVCSR